MSSTNLSINDLLPPQLIRLLPYYAFILTVFIFYSDVYDNAFLYDDRYLIVRNSYLQNWHSLGTLFETYVNSGALRSGHFYRPLQNLLYMVVYQIAGPSTFGFHLLNITLHAANACLMFSLGLRLKFKSWAVFLTTLLWALHPIQTEAVTYMSSTADTLHTFFCLLGVVILLPDFTPKKMGLGALFAVLGMLSKEAAIVFPALATSCLYLMSDKRLDPHTYLKMWPLWLVATIYLLMRYLFLPFSGADLLNIDPMSHIYATHISLRLYTFLATIPAYIQLFVWPIGLHMDRNFLVRLDPWFPEVALGLSVLILATITILTTRKRKRPALSWGLLWFGAAHFPQTGILIPVNALFLEHWMYLPSIGLFLGVAEAIASNLTRLVYTQAAAIFATAAALVLGVLTYQQNKIWHDAVIFYTNILDHGETSARARNNLGIVYAERGDYAKAAEQFQLALADNDVTPETHQNIAFLLSQSPDGRPHIQEEIDELNKALAINPKFMSAYQGLADLYRYIGDTDKANFNQNKADILRKSFSP